MNDGSTAFLRLANQARSRIKEVTPRDISQAKPVPRFIDIRETEEYARGHIPGARHLSRGVLEQKIGEMVPDLSTPRDQKKPEASAPGDRQRVNGESPSQ